MDPWWKNLFENALTVQFIHRTIAYVIVLYAGALWLWRRGQGGWLPRIALLVAAAGALGIGTLRACRSRCRWPWATRRWPSCWPAPSRPGSPI